MKFAFSQSTETYDGKQLRSLFNYLRHGLLGDSIVAWIGPCNVGVDHMVDGEDLRANAKIEGARMVHFVIELFNCDLLAAVALQRLLTSIVADELGRLTKNPELKLRRDGDDLYLEDRKLSISIATVSPVSALIHFAVNVTNEGTPVPTLSLQDLHVEPRTFVESVLPTFTKEVESIRIATQKVLWVN